MIILLIRGVNRVAGVRLVRRCFWAALAPSERSDSADMLTLRLRVVLWLLVLAEGGRGCGSPADASFDGFSPHPPPQAGGFRRRRPSGLHASHAGAPALQESCLPSPWPAGRLQHPAVPILVGGLVANDRRVVIVNGWVLRFRRRVEIDSVLFVTCFSPVMPSFDSIYRPALLPACLIASISRWPVRENSWPQSSSSSRWYLLWFQSSVISLAVSSSTTVGVLRIAGGRTSELERVARTSEQSGRWRPDC